jgi:mono/diheme cytochrome c family protein
VEKSRLLNKSISSIIHLAGALAIVAVSAFPQSAGNPQNGSRLFVKDGCYQCHGYDGHGGFGAKLAPRPMAVAAFIAYVRHPPPGDMPVYTAKVISDAELTDIWAFLKSIPDPPAVKDIPLLNQK